MRGLTFKSVSGFPIRTNVNSFGLKALLTVDTKTSTSHGFLNTQKNTGINYLQIC